MPFCRFDPNLSLRDAKSSSVLFLRFTCRDSSIIMWHDGVSTTILVPSCDTTASQRPFWSHRATRRHLNGHFGPIVRHDGVSMVILAPSCDTTASQWSFWSHHATRRRLNGHFGLVPWRDGISMAIHVAGISGLPLTLGAGTFRGGFFGLGRLGLCRFRLRRGRLGF